MFAAERKRRVRLKYKNTSRRPSTDQIMTVGVHAAASQKITNFFLPDCESESNLSRIPSTFSAFKRKNTTKKIKIRDWARKAVKSLKPKLWKIEAGKKRIFNTTIGVFGH